MPTQAIIDGGEFHTIQFHREHHQYIYETGILTDRSLERRAGNPQAYEEYKNNLDTRLSPESIAEVPST